MEGKLYLLVLTILCLGLQYAHSQDFTKTLLLEDQTGAVCLDGSPSGYYMRSGYGDGANKWILHIMGGGWCTTTLACYMRSYTPFGSSNNWPESMQWFGMFSSSEVVNPDFYNWNAVVFYYCDGGSFAGDMEEPDVYRGRSLYYRGYRNLRAIMFHLNSKMGLWDATDVILTGCSAGGLGVFLHADFIKTRIVDTAKYRAFPDAGYFLDIPDVSGSTAVTDSFNSLLKLQNIDGAIIPECRADYDDTELWKCLFASYIYNYVKTPIFVVNSQYDAYSLFVAYRQTCIPPNCNEVGTASFEHFKEEFDIKVHPVLSSPSSNGYFLDSCIVHCQTNFDDDTWNKYAIDGRTLAQSFGDWYFDKPANTRLKDCNKYPCNPTCSSVAPNKNRVFGFIPIPYPKPSSPRHDAL